MALFSKDARIATGGRIRLTAIVFSAAILIAATSTIASASTAAEFFRSICGSWIGTCDQTTDGKETDKKYFSASIREVNPTTFESSFEYYRVDSRNAKAVRAGNATVVTSIGADGKASSRIVGKGTILVDNKPKPLQHDFIESLACRGPGLYEGATSGSVKVSNMPFGLGKNGKIRVGTSSWRVTDGGLTIDQKLKVGFGILFVTKSFSVDAHYTARRGTDLAALISQASQVSLRPGAKG